MMEEWEKQKNDGIDLDHDSPLPPFHSSNVPFSGRSIVPIFQFSSLPAFLCSVCRSFAAQVWGDVNFSLPNFFYGGEKFRIRVFF